MPLGREVGLGPSDIMLDGDPQLPPKEAQPPILGPYHLLWPNGWMDQDATWYTKVDIDPGHIVLHGDPAHPKGAHPPNFRPMSIVAKRSPISSIAEHL